MSTVKFRCDVAGVNESRWSNNSMTYETQEQAEKYLDGLSMRWTGYDMARIVTEDTPTRELIDNNDPTIYQNYREWAK